MNNAIALGPLVNSLRPKQWIKNLFVFIPFIFGKRFFVQPYGFRALACFALFCLASSAVYLMNDIIDAPNDRSHRQKRHRPIASGRLGTGAALVTALLLSVVSVAAAFPLEPKLSAVIAVYLALNLFYTGYLKNIVIIDVFCIGLFFLMRVVAGTVTAQVALSHWMVFLIVLLAMFLGFNKRRQELVNEGVDAAARRSVLTKYSIYFIDQMIAVLTSSIVVVYMLYTVDQRTVNEFGTTHLIYSTPFVYYGIFRYLYIVIRRKEGEDPSLVLLKDGLMLVNLVAWIVVCMAVIYFRV
ncbi:MAG TPA: decaprenyl-phosphate phosphoribosyltransferase [Candidatus Eisenbacteria bacterium]|nr:decaprenyl-phosphate phosphoribosyltransferase [Candidatus Eisenbacteria bacterium]